jgi:hypothetical protein
MRWPGRSKDSRPGRPPAGLGRKLRRDLRHTGRTTLGAVHLAHDESASVMHRDLRHIGRTTLGAVHLAHDESASVKAGSLSGTCCGQR